MARIAKGRDRVLTREEIAAETLRQFDTGSEAPSIRALASALGVAPSAIYHHYESQAAIVHAATELVWEEVAREFLAAIPDLLEADPVEVLVTGGVVTRR
ncbi:MAG TPA: TetR/AcrR family transcriptional regulator, partial [Acidimicrobiia bacterium]|nr:TetR/AcrR family transcriptional regulator [Acidimicrobiia bacterium]